MLLPHNKTPMIRLLTFTNLYPDPVRPRHGIFVEHRLRRLVATGRVQAQVIAPVPWCPLPLDARYPHYRMRGIPQRDERDGIVVHHPRYWVVPGVSSALNPWSMARAAMPVIRQLMQQGYDFDVLDAQFIYPDAVAGALLARQLGKPVTFTARGSDVNVALREALPLRWFRRVQQQVAAFIAVSDALRSGLIAAGVDAARIHVIRNGVDTELFSPRDRQPTRQRLHMTRPTLLSVGNLVEEKGHRLVIEALAHLPQVELMVIGSGVQLSALQALANRLQVADRIRWVAHVNQAELAGYYSAADVTVLASSREGMPNVLLESLACGTPVVATNVGGCPEVVADAAAGLLLHERSVTAVVTALKTLLEHPVDRAATRAYALQFGWQAPIAQQLALLEQVVSAHTMARAA